MYKFILLLFLLTSFSVEARMYQWLDPDSGTTQLSGKPPAWYRSNQSGPRIFVFENGRIIDDTAVALSEDHRLMLRQKAFAYVEEEIERQKQAKEQQQEMSTGDEALAESDDEIDVPRRREASDESGTEPVNAFMQMTMEQMRTLIQDWESSQTEKAKEIINN